MSHVDSTKSARRTTRNSIRQSLNLASVGKALADVMNKEGKDSLRRKSTTSSKGAQSRRASTIGFNRVASDLEPVLEVKRLTSPDSKTVTQSRRSSSSLQTAGRMSLDETGVKLADTSIPQQQGAQTSALNRTSSVLRPRNVAAGSALPKYRPKSLLVESTYKKSASPTRLGFRRKHSSSEEDGSSTSTACAFVVHSPMEKAGRPISPIPRRAVKPGANPSPSANGRPTPSPTTKTSKTRESPVTSTPPRPRKAPKSSDSPVAKKTGLPRPSPLDTSRAPSASPRTPSLAKNVARYLGSKSGRESPSPSRGSALNGSPVSSKSRSKISKGSSENTPTIGTPTTSSFADKSLSAITEGTSCDSLEAGDVEFMLAAIASPTAPTPAIPRLRPVNFNQQPPQTPSRTFLQPPCSTLGLSLYPSNQSENRNEKALSSAGTPRRSSPQRKAVNERSSVAAWEKLADLSAEMNASELGGLITEVEVPFLPTTPGMLSPSPSVMRLDPEAPPDSPTPLNMPSPGGYTSISQVLLPNVTPSPAMPMRNHHYFSDVNGALDVPSMDSATVMLLKLQLASIENLAKERLAQITRLEEEMHVLKETKRRDEDELAVEVAQLEDRLREALVAPQHQPIVQDHSECRAVLEERLLQEADARQQAIFEAVSEAAEAERLRQEKILRKATIQQDMSSAMRCATRQWTNVSEIVDGELEFIASNRETLAVLRSGLDFFEGQIGAMLFNPIA